MYIFNIDKTIINVKGSIHGISNKYNLKNFCHSKPHKRGCNQMIYY